MMRLPLEITWPRAFVALAGCLEGYIAGRGFVPDLLRYFDVETGGGARGDDVGGEGGGNVGQGVCGLVGYSFHAWP